MIDRDAVILGVLKKIKGNFREPGVKHVWETGWGEILERIRAEGFSPALLKPQYMNGDEVIRYNGEYRYADASHDMDAAIRKSVIALHLKGEERIVELGCGTGLNQLLLAEICPEAELVAADWAKASQEIVREISAHLKRVIKPVNFNMFTLDGWDELGAEGAAVLTVHALEQLGDDWGLLLTALRKAKICVHLEPIVENYNEENLFDFLAAEYHRARGYLTGWLPAIRELEKQGKAEILRSDRIRFGNRYHEAYSILVWKPVNE